MKSIKFLFFAILAFSLVITACKKDETLTKTEMLTSKTWKVISTYVFGTTILPEECEKDDYIKFRAGGQLETNPGTIKCDVTDVVNYGTWALSSDEKNLVVDSTSYSITEFTTSKLVIMAATATDTIKVTLNSF